MKTMQVVLDSKLLKAAAKRRKLNRSALVREALQEHLKREENRVLEEIDRRGYLAQPQQKAEFEIWKDAAAWPND